ncbi:cation:proton antiporter, partial [Haladaptatus sp.]|uniref:cation:proton antiporter n=1 Tax=Haladaptatus sp. TaxID=1973141 RepID=UPI003C37DDE1
MSAEAASAQLLYIVTAIIGLGVISQVLADRFQVPSVLFLIAAGIIFGPVGLHLLNPSAFGDALSSIVGLSVAIIVFEGAFHLKVNKLREAPSAQIRLVTIGALISLLGTATVIRFALDQPWDLSLLIGSLLVATGPTVITPILSVVPVRDRVAAALETEGIANDVTAAILAVVMFEVLVLTGSSAFHVGEFFASFVRRLGTGMLVGILVAGIIWYILRHLDLSPGNAPQNSRLLVLVGALTAYAAADIVARESGIAAVATAGILLGNADLPYEEKIEEFKGDITLVVLSFVFITLAALLKPKDLFALGIGGAIVVFVVMFVIRPLIVFISTSGGRFTRDEKLFMGFVGPRGIIPASVATLFAFRIRNSADVIPNAEHAATVLIGTVFLVIVVTVVLEGGFARFIAEYLNVIPMRVLIIGGGKVGRSLAARLEDRGENVVLIEQDETIVQTAREEGYTVHDGDGTDTEVLRSSGAGNAKI